MTDATIRLDAAATEAPDAGLLCLQVHSELAEGLDVALLRAECQALVDAGHAIRLSFVDTEDDGPHLDAAFEAFHAGNLWSALRARLFGHPVLGPALRECSIAVRTGARGWDDYRVLAHFDPAATLDAP